MSERTILIRKDYINRIKKIGLKMNHNEENNGVEEVSASGTASVPTAETDSANHTESVTSSVLTNEEAGSERSNDRALAEVIESLENTDNREDDAASSEPDSSVTDSTSDLNEAEASAETPETSEAAPGTDAAQNEDSLLTGTPVETASSVITDEASGISADDPEADTAEREAEASSDGQTSENTGSENTGSEDTDSEDTLPEDISSEEDPDATGMIFLTEPVAEDDSEPDGVKIDLNDEDHTEKDAPDRELKLGGTDKKPKDRKKLWITLGSIAAVLAVIYLIGVWRFSQVFLPGTYVDGFSAANKSVAQTEELIKSGTAERTVTITGSDGKTETITAGDIDLVFSDNLDLESVIAQQNPWTWPAALAGSERRDLASDYTYSSEKLNALISASPFLTGTDIVATQNAKAAYDGSTFVVQKEIYGTQVDSDKLKDAVLKGLLTGQETLDLEESKIYVQPTVLEDSADLQASVSKLNQIASTVITYTFGNTNETVDKSVFLDWLSTDDQGNVSVDSTKAAAYIKGLADKYDTLYTYQSFNTSSGSTVEVYAAGYGWEIDQKEETAELVSLISSGSTTTREPVYESTGADRTLGNAVGGDYIEISISAQTMWCYSNGQLVTSTPVTTGTVSSGYGTPTGIYEIAYKDTNVNLEGNNADGSAYSSPVTFWIPFNGGIGIHDSSWRSSYGGDVYLTSGSHGCVNTPYSAVATIYENCYAGEPVVVY